MEKKTFTGSVYALVDNKGNVFYIGGTLNKLSRRLYCHLINARSKKPINATLVNMIRESNYDIKMLLIESISINQSCKNNARRILTALEGKWMQDFKELGAELCNKIIEHSKAYVFDEKWNMETIEFA